MSRLNPSEQATKGARARIANINLNRPKSIDPTINDIDYTREEVEFSLAVEEYKRVTGRRFPTNKEILSIVRDLGYDKIGRMA